MPNPFEPRIAEQITGYYDELVNLRRDIHAHPEIGFEEVRTSGIVAEKLQSWGIEVHRGIGKTGVVGILKGGKGGNRRVGLRADMDALPMTEDTGLPYASTIANRFHGCGHDGHTTMLLGAARYLAETRNFDGTAVFIFQPAEEGLGGARAMLADGLFERFPVDEIFGLHNSPFNPHGHFSVSHGSSMAGADFFDITVRGRGGHAASPGLARDPIVAASALVQGLQHIVSRNVAADEAAVLSVTSITSGDAYNIIPEYAYLRGTVRALSTVLKTQIADRIRAVAAGVALSHDVQIDVNIREVFSVLTNSDEQVDAVADIARSVLGDEFVSTAPRKVMGSEDFADFLGVVPGAFFTLGQHGTVPLHNPGFIFDDEIIPVGATLFARIIENRLPVAAG